jgi:hypothetical protein
LSVFSFGLVGMLAMIVLLSQCDLAIVLSDGLLSRCEQPIRNQKVCRLVKAILGGEEVHRMRTV